MDNMTREQMIICLQNRNFFEDREFVYTIHQLHPLLNYRFKIERKLEDMFKTDIDLYEHENGYYCKANCNIIYKGNIYFAIIENLKEEHRDDNGLFYDEISAFILKDFINNTELTYQDFVLRHTKEYLDLIVIEELYEFIVESYKNNFTEMKIKEQPPKVGKLTKYCKNDSI